MKLIKYYYYLALCDPSYIPKDILENNKELCIFLCENNIYYLKYLPEKYITYDLCLKSIKKIQFAIWDIIPYYLLDFKLCLTACKYENKIINFIPDKFFRIIYNIIKKINIKNKNYNTDYIIGNKNLNYSDYIELCENKHNKIKYISSIKYFTDYNLCESFCRNNGDNLEFIPKKFINYKLCVISIESSNYLKNLNIISDEFINENLINIITKRYKNKKNIFLLLNDKIIKFINYDLCVIACLCDKINIKYIPKKFFDYKLCNLLCNKYKNILKYIPTYFIDYNLCKKSCRTFFTNLKYIPKKFIDYEICEYACLNNGYNLKYVPDELVDYDLYKLACKNNGYKFDVIYENLLDYDLCEMVCKKNCYALESIPDKFIDYNLCKKICESGGDIYIIPKKFINYELCKISCINNNYSIKYIPKKFITKEICKIVCKRDNYNLQYIPNKFIDYDLIKYLIKYDDLYSEYIPKNNYNYKISKLICKYSHSGIVSLDKEIIDYNLCLISIKKNLSNIKLIPDKYKKDNIFLSILLPDYLENSKKDKLMKNNILLENKKKFYNCNFIFQ
jgi:hypothetical protein